MKNLNDLTMEVLQGLQKNEKESVRNSLSKALKKYEGQEINADLKKRITAEVQYACNINTLKKNELLTTVFDNEAVKFDFGPDTPEEVKKAAFAWAEKRGLKPSEASLNKSRGSFNYVVYGNSSVGMIPVSSYKLEID